MMQTNNLWTKSEKQGSKLVLPVDHSEQLFQIPLVRFSCLFWLFYELRNIAERR